MNPSEEKRARLLIIGIIIGFLGLAAGPALAALTFSGTGVTGDGAVVVDGPGTISIGTSTATGVTIGNPSSTVSFLGNVGIGTTTPAYPLTVAGGATITGPLVNTNIGSAFGCAAFANNDISFPFPDSSTGLAVLSNTSCPGWDYNAFLSDVEVDQDNGHTPTAGIFDVDQQTNMTQDMYGLEGGVYLNGPYTSSASAVGVQAFLNGSGGGTADKVIGFSASLSTFPVTINNVDQYSGLYGFQMKYIYVNSTPNIFGVWIPNLSAGTANAMYDFYGADLGASTGTIANPYYSWFDSQGVRRVKEDHSFNGVGQAIEALYNPQFTKYTPGAANYERIILGEWNSNVAEIGTENGGTGQARALAFITASTTRMTIGATGNVGIGTTAPSTTLQVAGTTPTIRIGNSSLAGCLEVGNSDGSAGINYVTFLNGVMSATTTKPADCQ